ncbi:MAG TPA: ABC transporter permease [Pyrinomonadaceae bacterium]|nr:ABC transporter permease [Pyrinomonadaceae bacterium]
MKTLLQDLRYGLRMLAKTPAFTLVAVASLALGIGLNTTIFSVVNVLLVRPVPVLKDQGHLVWLRASISYPDYVDYKDQTKSFSGMTAISGTSEFSLAQGGEPELIKGEYVTDNYFDVLGVNALKGRTFDQAAGSSAVPVVVLSEHLWRTRFNSDGAIVGRQVSLNGFSFTVIGVAPKNFIGTEVGLDRDLWVPLAMHPVLNTPDSSRAADPIANRFTERRSHWLAVFARLKPGVSREQAGDELTTVATHVAETYNGKVDPETLRSVRLLKMSGGMDPRDQEDALPVAGIVMAVVALVLLIACANIAGLLLARAAIRRRETAIRQALGATRRRLVRQWLTESILLGIAGGVLGLLLALWANQLLISSLQNTPLATLELGLDWRVLGFTLALSVATGIVFGLAPALHASRLDIVRALKSEDGGRAGLRRSRLRAVFVTAQVTLSVVLLIGAGLFIRSLQKASAIDPGFRVDSGLTVPVNLGLLRYKEAEGKNFYRNLLTRVEAQPGVERASLVRFAQLGFSFAQFQVFAEGGNAGSTKEGLSTGFNVVGPNYFKAMETPLRGRDFAQTDRDGAPGVAVVNETLAATLWPGEEALGKRISVSGPEGPFLEVVGVARDGKYRSLGEAPRPYIYQPVLQSYDPKMTLVVRTTGEPRSVAGAVSQQIRDLDANLPIADIKTLREQVDLSLFPSRIAAWTLGGFGLLALLLSAIGIYGVVSYSAAQRTREIGVRMALGARKKDVLSLVLGEGLSVIAIGLVVGLLLAFLATRAIASFLYGVSGTDPLTFAGVPLLLGFIALVACYVPARRATKVDPLNALRYE